MWAPRAPRLWPCARALRTRRASRREFPAAAGLGSGDEHRASGKARCKAPAASRGRRGRSAEDAVEKQPSNKGVPPEIDRLNAAMRKSPIVLHVQRLVPLSKGSQLRRYEVLLRSGSEEAPNSAPQRC